MISAEKLAEWQALAERAHPVRKGDRLSRVEDYNGQYVADFSSVGLSFADDAALARLLCEARPAILALVAEVERLRGDSAQALRDLIWDQIPYAFSTGKEPLAECTAEECVESAAREILELRDEVERLQKDAALGAAVRESRVLSLSRDALDRLMGDTDLDFDDSVEMQALRAIDRALAAEEAADE